MCVSPLQALSGDRSLDIMVDTMDNLHVDQYCLEVCLATHMTNSKTPHDSH